MVAGPKVVNNHLDPFHNLSVTVPSQFQPRIASFCMKNTVVSISAQNYLSFLDMEGIGDDIMENRVSTSRAQAYNTLSIE
jgi:hypothetical protein